MARSAEAGAVTTVVAEAELLAGLGSGSLSETVAVSVAGPLAFGVAMTVTVAEAPLGSVPRAQVTVPEALVHVPCVEDAEEKVRLEGRVSVTVAPVAVGGPVLLATTG